MLSNFFYIFKFFLIATLIGVIMIVLGMMLKLGDVGIYIQPLLVGGGSAVIALGISRQFSIMKEDGYFDTFSFKGLLKSKNKSTKNKKNVSQKKTATSTKNTIAAKPKPVAINKEVVDKK